MRLAEIANSPHDWPGLGIRDPGRLQLVVVQNAAAMQRYTDGRAPSWGAALAFPSSRTILLRADVGGLPTTLRHELAHLALHEAINVRVPLWFDEGYAGMAAGEWNRLDVFRLSWIVLRGRSPDFVQINAGLRDNARTAEDSYALAMSAVLELARRIPGGDLAPLFARLEEGVNFEDALREVTGLSVGQFESEWQRTLRSRYNILIWLAAGGLWGVIGLALGLALWYKRRADRPRRAALDVGWSVPAEELSGEDVTVPTAIGDRRHHDDSE